MISVFQADGVSLSAWGGLLVIYYEMTPSLVTTRAMMTAGERWRRTGGPVSAVVLIVVERNVPPPDPDAREEMLRQIRQFDAHTVGLGYVVRGEGFSAAIARAAISGMLLWLRPKFKTGVFGRLGAALDWVGQRAPELKPYASGESAREIERQCTPTRAANGPSLSASP